MIGHLPRMSCARGGDVGRTTTIERAARLVALIELFKAGHRLNVAELAERFDVTPRTIRRDLLRLQGEPFYLPLVCRQSHTEEWRIAHD